MDTRIIKSRCSLRIEIKFQGLISKPMQKLLFSIHRYRENQVMVQTHWTYFINKNMINQYMSVINDNNIKLFPSMSSKFWHNKYKHWRLSHTHHRAISLQLHSSSRSSLNLFLAQALNIIKTFNNKI